MNIHFPFKRQALAGALVLMLVAACLPAPQAPTAAPNVNFAPTLPGPTAAAPTAAPYAAEATAALTPIAAVTATAAPTPTYTRPASDLSTLPDPVAGWQLGDRSVPITITEYGDFQ